MVVPPVQPVPTLPNVFLVAVLPSESALLDVAVSGIDHGSRMATPHILARPLQGGLVRRMPPEVRRRCASSSACCDGRTGNFSSLKLVHGPFCGRLVERIGVEHPAEVFRRREGSYSHS